WTAGGVGGCGGVHRRGVGRVGIDGKAAFLLTLTSLCWRCRPQSRGDWSAAWRRWPRSDCYSRCWTVRGAGCRPWASGGGWSVGRLVGCDQRDPAAVALALAEGGGQEDLHQQGGLRGGVHPG